MPVLRVTLLRGERLNDLPIAVEVLDETLEPRWKGAIAVGEFADVSGLKAGRHAVQAHLPGGQTLSAVGDVQPGDVVTEVKIDIAGGSLRESLEWVTVCRPGVLREAEQRECQLRSVWLRLWERNASGRWSVVPWPTQTPERDHGIVQYTFDFRTCGQFAQRFLQVGGDTMPWRLHALPADDIRVLVSGAGPSSSDGAAEHPVEVTVASQHLPTEALLGHLQRGEFEQARIVGGATVAEEVLKGKVENPAAAAVAGYFLLGTGELDRLKELWTNNLSRWMRWLPDGAVIHAWRLLRSGDAMRIPEARRSAIDAVLRGVPVYTHGVRLLVDALAVFEDDEQYCDDAVTSALKQIRRYAAALDWRSPTTALAGKDPLTPGSVAIGRPRDPRHVVFVSDPDTEELAWKRGTRSGPARAPHTEAPVMVSRGIDQDYRIAQGELDDDDVLDVASPDGETAVIDSARRRFAERAGSRIVPPPATPRATGKVSRELVARLLRAVRTQSEGEERAAVEPVAVPLDEAESAPLQGLAPRRVVGLTDLLSIHFLHGGLNTARSVGCLRVFDSHGRRERFGTGTLVSPRLLLTSSRTLPSAASAAGAVVVFDHQDGPDGALAAVVQIGLDPDAFFASNPTLGVSVVAVSGSRAPQAFGSIWLSGDRSKMVPGEFLSLIQHGDGAPKQVSLRTHRFLDSFGDYLHYDHSVTAPAAGAPLFNDQWELIGLHHVSIPTPPGAAPERWAFHEGVRASSIRHFLAGLDLSGDRAALRDEALLVRPRAPRQKRAGQVRVPPRARNAPEVASDIDVFKRRSTHFVLWCPLALPSTPHLVIGLFQPGNPPTLTDERRIPLSLVSGMDGLWQVAADDCALRESMTYHYWFEIDDRNTGASPPRRILCTDPMAHAVDWRLLSPVLGEPYGPDDRQPAAVIRFQDSRLVPCDPGGEVAGATVDGYLGSLPTNERMVIYELPTAWTRSLDTAGQEMAIGTFRDVTALVSEQDDGANFAGADIVRPGRSYLKELGVNALELLPPADSAYRREWGYGTTNFFAPDFDLGLPEGHATPTSNVDLIRLVDACHRAGIRVIADMVMAFARKGPYEYIDFPQFHIAHPERQPDDPDALTSTRGFGVREVRNGYGSALFRYAAFTSAYDPIAGHTASISPARQFMQVALARWMRDFRIDGIRMDSVENVANWDFIGEFTRSAHRLWRSRWQADTSCADAASRFLVIGEELSLPMAILEQQRLDGLWNDQFRARVRAALLAEDEGEASFEWNLRKALDCRLLGFRSGTQAVNYLTSHDVQGWRRERLCTFLTRAGVGEIEKRIKLGFVCLLTAVGIPMILAGEEFADEHDRFDLMGDVTQEGGKQTDPVNFSRQSDPMRRRIFEYVARLIRLRTTHPSLAGDQIAFVHTDFNDGKRVLVWCRGRPNGDPVMVVANFSDFTSASFGLPDAEYVVPGWPDTPPGRTWREVTQDRAVPSEWIGREPIVAWEAKVYVLS